MHLLESKDARLGGSGACSPRKFLEVRCSEIASEAILGQKQSRSSCMARGALHLIFGCPCTDLVNKLTSNFHTRRYYGWQNSRWGEIASRTNGDSRAAEIMIYIRTYLRVPFQRCSVNSVPRWSSMNKLA